jgi:nicotinate-nucleotide pyrophosphorylase (carboxylating)
MPEFPLKEARRLVRAALAEDIGRGDITTNSVIPTGTIARGTLLAKVDGIVAGLPLLTLVFSLLDRRVKIRFLTRDGDPCKPGQKLASLHGPARALLTGERTALNFIQRLSGIATLTHQFTHRVSARRVRILDTRKTTPTLRALEKYAVACGGGTNHRFGLYDEILIKDNHLAVRRKAGAARSGRVIAGAVEAARKANPRATIEIETTTPAEAVEASEAGADIILLDNMKPAQMKKAVRLIAGRAKIEASGGITLSNIAAVAATGVDFISIGALTHSAPALDLSLEIEN